jgi:cytidine deaminase
MRVFYDEMTTALTTKDNDIDRFWLRKSHKPVLAVLLVQSSSSLPTMTEATAASHLRTPTYQLYRGTNMEVSMPTGSLCAERNAIGSALAMNPNLKRQDLKMIAVLAVPPVVLESQSVTPISTISIETNDNIATIKAIAKSTRDGGDGGGSSKSGTLRHVASYSSILEESLDPNDNDRNLAIKSNYNSRKSSIGSDYEPTTSSATVDEWIVSEQRHGEEELQVSLHVQSDKVILSSNSSTEPVRRIPLFSKSPPSQFTTSDVRRPSTKKRTVVVQSTKDMNPLVPCGACNEWLKKIAQSNPYFKIITFTDANCNGVYISSCQD